MKKFLLVLFLCFSTISFAQKTTVGLQTFKAINEENWSEAESVTEKVKEVFVKSKRFAVLDRTLYTQTNIFKEKEIQKNIDFINGFVVKQGRSQGAKHIIGGKIITSSYSTTKSGLIKCDLSFSISVSDVETGELLYSEVISPNFAMSTLTKPSATEDSSLLNSLTSLEKKINDFIEEYVSFYTDIVNLEQIESKKGIDIVKTILVNAGDDDGMRKNDKFSICEVTYVETSKGKKKREKQIATFKISKVEGELSEGKITKGGEKLAEKFNNKEVVLVCKSLKNSLINF